MRGQLSFRVIGIEAFDQQRFVRIDLRQLVPVLIWIMHKVLDFADTVVGPALDRQQIVRVYRARIGKRKRHILDRLPITAPHVHDCEAALHQVFGLFIANQIAQPVTGRPVGIIVMNHLHRLAHGTYCPYAFVTGPQRVIEYNDQPGAGHLFDQVLDLFFIGRRPRRIVVEIDIGMVRYQLKTFAVDTQFVRERPDIGDFHPTGFVIAFVPAFSLAGFRRQADWRCAVADGKGQVGFDRIQALGVF
jgi:hypothetical protein